MSTLITEDLLRQVGFKWEQQDRQPSKHWLLWLGDALLCADGGNYSHDTIGIELADNLGKDWYCWLRSDLACRYSRLIHVRHLHYWEDVVHLIQGITGREWRAEDVLYGSLRSPLQAERLRQEAQRLDLRIAKQRDERIAAQAKEDLAKRGTTLP